MKKIKGIFYIIFSIGLLIILGVLFYSMILSEFYIETDFDKSGNAINKSIVWITLIGFAAINGLVYGVKLIMPVKDYNKQNIDLGNKTIEIKGKPRFDILFRTTFTDIWTESLIYLLIGVVVLPQFQDNAFIDSFQLKNIIIMLSIIIGGLFISRLIFTAFRYYFTFKRIKEIKHIISVEGIEIITDNKSYKFGWTSIKSFRETRMFFKLKQDRLKQFHIYKGYIDSSDQAKLRKILLMNVG